MVSEPTWRTSLVRHLESDSPLPGKRPRVTILRTRYKTGGFPMAQISPLRRRMIEDMTVRNLSPATQQSYLNAVSKFSRYFSRSPDRLGLEDVHAFQVHLVATGISWPALNQIVCALRFFYGVTLNQDMVPERIA